MGAGLGEGGRFGRDCFDIDIVSINKVMPMEMARVWKLT